MNIVEKTHQQFLDEMLGNLKNTEDKSPNSFSYDNLSSASIIFVEFQNLIIQLWRMFDVNNLEDEELERRVFQVAGLKRKQETQATGFVKVSGKQDTVIPNGTVFLSGNTKFIATDNYTISEKGFVDVKVLCVEFGVAGDVGKGSINKLEKSIEGVESISNELPFTNGYLQETDDDLRERFYDKLQNPPKAGNPAHYKLWAEEVDGVGYAKVYRTWKGPSTVKVVVIGLDRKALDEEMVEKVRKHIIEETPIHWENLTVVSGKEVKLNIDVKLKIKDGYTSDQVQKNIKENVEAYLTTVAFKQSFISYAKIACAIMSAEGVSDHDNLKINEGIENIKLEDEQVGVMGTLKVMEDEL